MPFLSGSQCFGFVSFFIFTCLICRYCSVAKSCPALCNPIGCTSSSVGKVMSLLLNTLSWLVITFLPRSKSVFNFMTAVTVHSDFGEQKIKSVTASTYPSIFAMKWWDWMSWSHQFLASFSLSSFTFIKRLLSSSSLCAIRVVSSTYLRLLIFLSNRDSSLWFFHLAFCMM